MQCYHAYIAGTIEHMLHVITQYGSTLQDVHWNMSCMLKKKKGETFKYQCMFANSLQNKYLERNNYIYNYQGNFWQFQHHPN